MNIKADHFIWKIICVVQVAVTLFSIYENQSSAFYEASTSFMQSFLLVTDFLVLAANIFLILQVRVLSQKVWLLIVLLWWFVNVFCLLNEFYLGGYTSSEMLFMGNIIWILILFSLPVLKYGAFVSDTAKT
ncbi:hypothetical protein [Pseudoalteromonas luteoviolacea]|uniref:Uncharacterized protein n=1 Tax=Pseudoalteromonas luteoviolacea S4054 TaxID=1129367 RepID=A0A0F6A6N2_9GAMM|nr:hypothetical protein [Pseudoalteromonas luteoviolacea]AOT10929.1 hypothetical protein S4054249_24125 [Pseudoalteromonas luteoviolacea]AOT15907.1 hypothetical protein S40542_24385 [Pseudoalteromonas luteoviolacea]AOT20750.1 hypothetical protein S4054_24045 [Pseudoalteromonas luteoviolacea]KKE81857.1 hypothetical protein N479_02535 [Pseudoalteromonas luteoviolacea S4054]KZN66185.1 hypothetical protein N481_24545 [Pseudoalteromonas luteoviolacea S4047-1]